MDLCSFVKFENFKIKDIIELGSSMRFIIHIHYGHRYTVCNDTTNHPQERQSIEGRITDISTASRLSTVVMEVPNMTCSNEHIVNARPMMWMRKSLRATIRVTTSRALMVCNKLKPFIIQ